ncbi:4-oxalocrotonate tautomerase family protein [Streptomyces gamaensis]|uniref:4-oxalocrotonate tautomerase family protein n=1 Tax=Streptomyces gamaensis TaxID=1763542 RepID=A0ABW0YZU2_9ACTN
MPFYECRFTEGMLDKDQKAELAKAITDIHVRNTGAAEYFVHVFMTDVRTEDGYVAGRPQKLGTIFARIRAGRTDETKHTMMRELTAAASRISGLPLDDTIAVFQDVPATYIMNGDKLAPEPGEDAQWLGKGKNT